MPTGDEKAKPGKIKISERNLKKNHDRRDMKQYYDIYKDTEYRLIHSKTSFPKKKFELRRFQRQIVTLKDANGQLVTYLKNIKQKWKENIEIEMSTSKIPKKIFPTYKNKMDFL